MTIAFCAMLSAILATCLGQLAMKRAQQEGARQYPLNNLLNPIMILGLGALFGATLLNSFALRQISLGTFTAWNAAVYPLTVLGAVVFLGEQINKRIILGVTLVCGGIILFSI